MADTLRNWWPTLVGLPLIGALAWLVVPGLRSSEAEAEAPAANAQEAVASASLGDEEQLAQSEEESRRKLHDQIRQRRERESRRAALELGEAELPEFAPDREPTDPAALSFSDPAVQAALASVKVELYETSWCKYCRKTRAFLSARGVSFRSYDVEADRDADLRRQALTGKPGVPVTVIGNEVVSGYREANLDSLLRRAVATEMDRP